MSLLRSPSPQYFTPPPYFQTAQRSLWGIGRGHPFTSVLISAAGGAREVQSSSGVLSCSSGHDSRASSDSTAQTTFWGAGHPVTSVRVQPVTEGVRAPSQVLLATPQETLWGASRNVQLTAFTDLIFSRPSSGISQPTGSVLSGAQRSTNPFLSTCTNPFLCTTPSHDQKSAGDLM